MSCINYSAGRAMKGLMLWLTFASIILSVSASLSCTNTNRTCGNIVVEADASAVVATTGETFLCATLDWWPPDKCDYGTCSWGRASILNLDLTNPLLSKTLTALHPFQVRLGGTLQDHIVYDVGTPAQPCLPIVKDAATMFGFREGCLSLERWIALNKLFSQTGTLVVFGLNALFNRHQVGGVWGPWDPSNAHEFIKFTVEQGIQVQAWELGNELSANGVGTTITPEQYAEDVKELRLILNSLYQGFTQRPLLIAPDGFFNYAWFTAFLKASGSGVVDVVTRHIYNLGPGVSTDLVQKILDPEYLNNELGSYQAVQNILQTTAPWASAWVGEAGGAYNSGQHLVTDAFVFSFWYLDELGMAASFNNKAYCRQSFIGGNYGLLNTSTFEPNPDFYSALLWNRLMGSKVLATKLVGSPELRAYTHCQKGWPGGLTVLLINVSNTTVNVNVGLISVPTNKLASKETKKVTVLLIPRNSKITVSPTTRLEYHLSAPYNNLHSQTVLLNGKPLVLTPLGNLPTLEPVAKNNSSPLSLDPLSVAFVALPNAKVPICM